MIFAVKLSKLLAANSGLFAKMSIFKSLGLKFTQLARNSLVNQQVSRNFTLSTARFCAAKEEKEVSEVAPGENPNKLNTRPDIDRTKIIPVETSIRYILSEAYRTTYGDQPVWTQYRRNHKGQTPPKKTRKTCIRAGLISTGNPCPICRDEYLVLDHRNLDLLKQFISPFTGQVTVFSLFRLRLLKIQNLN